MSRCGANAAPQGPKSDACGQPEVLEPILHCWSRKGSRASPRALHFSPCVGVAPAMMQASLALRARAQIASDRTLHGSSSSSAPARRPVAALASAREAASGRHASLRFARRRASRISAAPGDGKSLVYPETEAPPPDCKVGFDDGYGAQTPMHNFPTRSELRPGRGRRAKLLPPELIKCFTRAHRSARLRG